MQNGIIFITLYKLFSDANCVVMKHLLLTTIALLFAFNLSAQHSHNGHEYIDLGLSVKWATYNVGANTPEEYGDYYAWGETTTKSTYYASNCTTWKEDIGDIAGILQYDAATAKWGGSWRMPTLAEFNELHKNCTWVWTTHSGTGGYEVTSKINGNSIFLPTAGYYAEESLESDGVRGMYWVSTPASEGTQYAYNFYFDKGYQCAYWISRADGHSIRPVLNIDSDDATNGSEDSGDNDSEDSGDKNSKDYRIGKDSATEKPTNEEPVNEEQVNNKPMKAVIVNTHNGHAYVDLGLSVKWATYNVGANVPEEYGDYYAWGETTTKSTYTEGAYVADTKNYKDIKGTSLDVARVKWGGNWRMPTKTEFEELLNGCIWEWTTQNGVNGYVVTGPNGNNIFLPAAGNRSEDVLYYNGSFGFYWSSTPGSKDNTQGAHYLGFGSSDQGMSWDSCYLGRTVRLVLD